MFKYILAMALLVVATFWLLIGAVELGSFVGALLPSIPRWAGFSAYMAFLGGLIGYWLWLIGVTFPFLRR